MAVAPKHKFKFKNPLYAIDSTTIDLCLSRYNWAYYRKHKGAMKSRQTGICRSKRNFSALYCSEIFTGQQWCKVCIISGKLSFFHFLIIWAKRMLHSEMKWSCFIFAKANASSGKAIYEAHLRCMKQSFGLWSTPVGVWSEALTGFMFFLPGNKKTQNRSFELCGQKNSPE